jgi:hypothetical protein
MVRANMDIAADTPVADGYQAVVAGVQSTYACMGISCDDIGGLLDGDSYYAGLEPCTDAPAPPVSGPPMACYDVSGTIAGVAHRCVCDADNCNGDTCAANGGVWTEGCSCTCDTDSGDGGGDLCLAEDSTGDGRVNVQDLLAVLASFQCTLETCGTPCGTAGR